MDTSLVERIRPEAFGRGSKDLGTLDVVAFMMLFVQSCTSVIVLALTSHRKALHPLKLELTHVVFVARLDLCQPHRCW